MAQPADRVEGVVLVTDYGALDRALKLKAKMEAEASDEETTEPAWVSGINIIKYHTGNGWGYSHFKGI